jgi:hypothetical protein
MLTAGMVRIITLKPSVISVPECVMNTWAVTTGTPWLSTSYVIKYLVHETLIPVARENSNFVLLESMNPNPEPFEQCCRSGSDFNFMWIRIRLPKMMQIRIWIRNTVI